MHEAHAEAESIGRSIGKRLPLSVNVDFRSWIGIVKAGDALDERGFPASVLADQRVDLTRCDVEVHVGDNSGAGKSL